MRRIPPSVHVREELNRLLERGATPRRASFQPSSSSPSVSLPRSCSRPSRPTSWVAGAVTSAEERANRDRGTAMGQAGSAPPRGRFPSRSPRCEAPTSRSVRA
jgi:hypothetical protein